MTPITESTYLELFKHIKTLIINAKLQAVYAVNRELIRLYQQIGEKIVEKQQGETWGKSVVEQLSKDLKASFPAEKGFSTQNLWLMRQFYLCYKDNEILYQLAREIPWMHNVMIFTKIKEKEAQEYYIQSVISFHWSRNVLLNKIKAAAYQRYIENPLQHNFAATLPEHLAELAKETLKSSYILDFLGVTEPLLERELEKRLVTYIKAFLLELGKGFAFLGNQYRLTLGENEYFIDLLFYHRSLKCLIAIELKTGEFKPEYAGKMNFYLELLDEKERLTGENPAIGIILCAEKDDLEVEYALRTSHKPVGVAEYILTQNPPEEVRNQFPSTEELKNALQKFLR